MTGRLVVLLVLLATLPMLTLGAATPAVARSPASQVGRADDTDPLRVEIDSISPAVIPRKGPVQVTGTVRNVSEETWSLINLYALVSHEPITTAGELALNAAADPNQQFGNRIVEPELDLRIDALEPGESAPYSIRVPQDTLMSYLQYPSAPGVYRIGIQALGETVEGRVDTADGRAYSYIPLLADRPDPVRAALVVPIRRAVTHARDGSLRGVGGWARDLGPGGRLRNLLDFGSGESPVAVTWLVDPAVLEAVQRIADGNPPRDLGPVSDGSPEPSRSASPTPADDPAGTGAAQVAVDEASRWAREWLARFDEETLGRQVLGLPYGDVDMAAALALDPRFAERALALSASTFKDRGISAVPTVAPPSGYLDPSSDTTVGDEVSVLGSDAVLDAPSGETEDGPTTISVGGHDIDLYDAAASSGGPGPTDPLAELAIRQRLVSEAALRSNTGSTQPLLVSMPADWNPGPSQAGFFDALDLSWLSVVPQQLLSAPDPATVAAEDLAYPDRQDDLELDSGNISAAERLTREGTILQNVLSDNNTVEREVAAQAFTTTSYAVRAEPTRGVSDANRARRFIEANLNQVSITTPRFVTLSSASGNKFRVDLANDLPQTVTFRIKAIADPNLTVETPKAPIRLEGGSNTSLFLGVESTQLGPREVLLALVDEDGARFGPSADLPIRSSQSGRIIWVIIGVGAALLFGAIAVRLFRRLTGRTAKVGQQ